MTTGAPTESDASPRRGKIIPGLGALRDTAAAKTIRLLPNCGVCTRKIKADGSHICPGPKKG